MFRFAQQAHLSPKREPCGLLAEVHRGNDRPADILIPNFSAGKTLCLDVTIVSSFSEIAKASSASGYNAERAANSKRQKYEASLEQLGYVFQPFAMESIGGMESDCFSFMSFLGDRLASVTNYSPSKATNTIKKKLSFVWQRCLGASLMDHARYSSDLMVYAS